MRAGALALLGLAAALVLGGCGSPAANTAAEGMRLDETHPLYGHFTEAYPDKTALLNFAGDCNNDGIEDLTVVYIESASENKMVTVYSAGEGYQISPPLPAPVENCQLQWKDIDEAGQVEMLVSGQKGAKLGFAVMRFENGTWTNLFGEGMEDCC